MALAPPGWLRGIEHDSMGEVAVPADALWGAQTQRAAGRTSQVSGEPLIPRP